MNRAELDDPIGATLFVRRATGLVRSWSMFDAFIYAFFSVNLVTLGLYIISQMYFLEGGLIPTLLLSAGLILAEVVVYAGLIAVMPRAGGDYVWQSRILGGGIGFVLAVTGWWFILWLWTPLYADMLRHVVVVPLLAVAGARDAALWWAWQPAAWFLAAVITLAFVTAVIALGMKTYARVQRFCFWGGNLGLLLVCLILLVNDHAAFRAGLEANATRLLGAHAGVYEATLAAGAAAGAKQPLLGGTLAAILLAMPYIVFFNLWPNWGATLYGEVKGADDFKRNFWGMALGLLVTTALALLLYLSIARTITWEFYVNANAAYWNYRWGYSDTPPPLPVWPYPALLAAFLSTNPLLQALLLLAMSLWFFGWAGTMFLSSTRVIFAAAFDRLLPEVVARVDPRTRTPIYALLLMVIPGLIVSALYAWNIFGFQSLTLASTLVIAITYFGSTIAAILLPYTKRDLYLASPIAKYNVAGVPLISIAGTIFAVFLGYLLYQWLVDPHQLYGISYRNTASVLFMGALYGLALAIYVGARLYRRHREGIDLGMVYREIPVD
ncbi:amino acid permease [Kallotenue papyrolyticum]|uniref:amino acid permease n=1 Tax=Kallotenue papyrolyticum TaxID=1325125 RepID=UPI000492863C|nr:APC family permease [Kallotenue papyrolyticum]